MDGKLNEDFIREYSIRFSEKITTDLFVDTDKLTGKDLINATPSKQVNFFILKILFSKWQEEMKNLESPYFDYKDPEVRRAMVDFMNVLSQHILIDGDHFFELAEEAVENTLVLLASPSNFLKRELEAKNITSLTDKISKQTLKYIKVYKGELETLFNLNQGKALQEFLKLSEEHFENVENADEIYQELDSISGVVPVSIDDLLHKVQEKREEFTQEEDKASAFDLADAEVEESEQETVKYADRSEADDSLDPEEKPKDVPEPSAESDLVSDESEEDQENAEQEESGSSTDSVNEKYTVLSATLNDQFEEEEEGNTVVEKMQNGKVASIMEAISVNHRYMFTQELFAGNREAFHEAIEEVEQCETFDDAVELLVESYAKERDWDMNSDEVKELLKMVFRKFR